MFLTIKKIPKVSWSSKKPLNLRPKLTTFLFLTFGVKNEWSRSVNRRMRGSQAPAAGNKNSLVRH